MVLPSGAVCEVAVERHAPRPATIDKREYFGVIEEALEDEGV